MCYKVVGKQTLFHFSSQALITFGEMWEDKLSPNRTLTTNFFLKEGKNIEKKPLFKSYSIKPPKYLAPLGPPTHQVDHSLIAL